MEHRSEQIDQLAISLAKAQSEMAFASLSNDNPFFKSKYAGLDEMIKASRPALTKNGLAVTQQILPGIDCQHVLHTVLLHSSGQWIESMMNINPQKTDIQSFGSYVSYVRRYSYAALVGVVASDEDDDGEKAMVEVRRSVQTTQTTDEKVSKDQLDEILYELEGYPDMAADILNKLAIPSFSDLKKSLFRSTVTRIRDIKRLENTTKKS